MNRNYDPLEAMSREKYEKMLKSEHKMAQKGWSFSKKVTEWANLKNPINRKVYLIGSLANNHIPKYAKLLRKELDCEVFDDWHAAHKEADTEWRDYEIARGRSYPEALRAPAAQNVYKFDLGHLNSSTHGLLVLPAGRSGHLELGWMAGAGKSTAILLDADHDRWDVMYAFADIVTTDIQEIITKWKDTPVNEIDKIL